MEQPYKITGTKITSPYPVKLTPAETHLVYSLQKLFDPENILIDCYFPKPDSKPNDQRIKNHVVSDAELLQIDCLAVDERESLFLNLKVILAGFLVMATASIGLKFPLTAKTNINFIVPSAKMLPMFPPLPVFLAPSYRFIP